MDGETSTAKAVMIVWGDSIVATLVGGALTVLVLAAGLAGIDDAADVTRQPSARRIAYELSESADRDVAEEILERLRGRFAPAPDRYRFALEEKEGSFWVVAWYRDEAVRGEVHQIVRASGRWSGRLESGSVAAFATERLAFDPVGTLSSMTWILPLLVPLAGIGYLLAGLAFRRLRPVEAYEIAPPSWGRSVMLGMGVGAAGLALANVVTFAVGLIGLEAEEQALVLELSRGGPVAVGTLVLLAVTVAPAGEELFFRGHVFRYLAVRAGAGIAYGVSALIFAAVHLNPSAIPAYLVAGVVLAWTYQRWRCLRIPMIAHATWNAISVGLLLLV